MKDSREGEEGRSRPAGLGAYVRSPDLTGPGLRSIPAVVSVGWEQPVGRVASAHPSGEGDAGTRPLSSPQQLTCLVGRQRPQPCVSSAPMGWAWGRGIQLGQVPTARAAGGRPVPAPGLPWKVTQDSQPAALGVSGRPSNVNEGWTSPEEIKP